MRMNELDIWVWEELKVTKNPMFTIGELCRRKTPNHRSTHSTDHPLYSAMRRSIVKFEKFGLLHIYRVTNGGTVFMSKVRAL
jgi:hypothetical protein